MRSSFSAAGSFAVVLGCVAALFAGCGTKDNNGFDDGGADDGGPGADVTTIPFDEGGILNNEGGAGDASNVLHCSSDLHSVLDANDQVVKTCPPDQGCGAGAQCVPACQAAQYNKSTIGCDYYSVAPDIISVGQGACFAAFIANTWNDPVTIAVERAGQQLPVAGAARIPSGSGQAITYAPLPNAQLPPGQVAIVFLSRFGASLTSCPNGVTPAYTAGQAATAGTGVGQAFHVTTTRPVVAYDIFPYGGGASAATSATLLLPTSAWDTNYVGVNAFRKSTAVPQAQPSMAVVAQADNTTVTISPTAAIVGGSGVAATGKGVPHTYNLNKGQYVQFTQDAELTGSPIQSNNPVALWAGATCLNIDVADVACDSAHQQIPPVKALGHEYIGVRYKNRYATEESVPWRFVGAVDGTTLTYEPTTPMGAPTTLAAGQLAEFWGPGPFIVRSQDDKHPFYLSQHMTGCSKYWGNSGDCRGDPEFVNVIPPEQYLASYTFFTDPTYPETNLVVVRKKGPSGFADVNLDCAGNLTGWMPLGNSGAYEYTRTNLVTGNFAKVGACDNGRHEMKSAQPFGLTVWGWGSQASGFNSQAVSYAYPAGASVQPINTVVVPPNPK